MLYKSYRSSALLYLRFIRKHVREIEDALQMLKGVQRELVLMRKHYRGILCTPSNLT